MPLILRNVHYLHVLKVWCGCGQASLCSVLFMLKRATRCHCDRHLSFRFNFNTVISVGFWRDMKFLTDSLTYNTLIGEECDSVDVLPFTF